MALATCTPLCPYFSYHIHIKLWHGIGHPDQPCTWMGRVEVLDPTPCGVGPTNKLIHLDEDDGPGLMASVASPGCHKFNHSDNDTLPG